jgi:polyisoprenoid-binding protein YceI
VTGIKRFSKAHPVVAVVIGLTVLLTATAAGAAWWVWRDLQVAYVDVKFVVPEAPRLTPRSPDQTLFRIDASRSSVTYEVDEILAGVSRRATGSTSGIAGDILVDEGDPTATQVGRIVVDVQQLTSDQSLRDQRLQHDFLESVEFPLATFDTSDIVGLPDRIDDGADYEVELTGELTVKETTAPVTFRGTARRDGAELRLAAAAEVKLSTFDVGPISLIGFVKTGDDATLTLDIVAVDAAEHTVPNAVDGPRREQTVAGGGPSFATRVQPVLESRCASCHNPGEVGADIWTLDTAGDAAEVASGLGLVTSSRFMPPWPASNVGVPMKHSNALTDEQLATIVDWANAGGPLDVDPTTPVRAATSQIEPLRRDIELPLAVPYQGSNARVNDYRCMILDPKLADTVHVTGFAFEPDQTEIVHHALGFRVRAEGRESLERLDAADGAPGWECYTGTGATSSTPGGTDDISTQFMAWAPGQAPSRHPEGTGMRMDAGDVLVVQIHYHYAHSNPPDRSRLVLDLADPDDDLQELDYAVYLAPAEIPCSTAESGPLCERSAVLEQLNGRYGAIATAIANALHRVCGTKPEDFAGMTSGTASASCDHRIYEDAEMLAVFGHMHEIGKTYRMTLNPGEPDEKVILDIPNWDFGWQFNYQPVDQIVLKKGDVLRVECSWDRSLMPQPEPRYVTWAEGTEDEMCYSTVTSRARR